MTAVKPTMTMNKTGTASAPRSRRESTGKPNHGGTANVENTSAKDLALAGLSEGNTKIQDIEAKYTKVCSVLKSHISYIHLKF